MHGPLNVKFIHSSLHWIHCVLVWWTLACWESMTHILLYFWGLALECGMLLRASTIAWKVLQPSKAYDEHTLPQRVWLCHECTKKLSCYSLCPQKPTLHRVNIKTRIYDKGNQWHLSQVFSVLSHMNSIFKEYFGLWREHFIMVCNCIVTNMS
jgi:hypothetical protein